MRSPLGVRPSRQGLLASLGVSLTLGTTIGIAEGLRALDANAYSALDRFGMFFFGSALLLTTAFCLAVGSLTFGVLWLTLRRRPPDRGSAWASAQQGIVAAVLVIVLGGAAGAFWVSDFASALRMLGARGTLLLPLAASGILGLVMLVAAIAASVARRLSERLSPLQRRILLAACALANLAFVPLVTLQVIEEYPGVVPMARSEAVSAQRGTNLLLISLDTVRADHVGVYGGGTDLTPAIDALAREGVVFEQAISPAPWTLPAMASLVTGLTPREHGGGWPIHGRDPLARTPIREAAPTLAERLRDSGYRTQGFVTNPFLTARYGFQRGFDGFHNLSLTAEAVESSAGVTAVRLALSLAPGLAPSARGDAVTAAAVEWLADHHDERFFLWLHYLDPHAPYVDPYRVDETSFRGDSILHGDSHWDLEVARIRSGEVQLSDADRRRVQQAYRRSVHFVDDQIAAVWRELRTLGLDGNTLVVVVADHGEELFDHGGIEHGHTLHEELIHVPLVVRGPGVPRGRRVGGLVRLRDLAPTLLDLLGEPVLPGASGRSLRAAMGRGESDVEFVLAESLLFAAEHQAIRTPTSKYIQWPDGRRELYELDADPGELVDLSGCRSDDDLAGYREQLAREPARTPAVSASEPPSVWERRSLEALGYLESTR